MTAVLDYGGMPRLLASFPFPHVLTQDVTLADRTLTIETTVMPTTAASVPLCFGYHPYLRMPGVPRADWLLTTPNMRHLPVDNWGIPTGEQEDWNGATEPLKTVEYDDGFDNVPDNSVFTLAGGGRQHRRQVREGLPGGSALRAPQRRRDRHRTHGRADGRAATRKLPLRGCRQAGNGPVLDQGDVAQPLEPAIRRCACAARHLAARPPARCSSAPPPRRAAGWPAAAPARRPSRRAATAGRRPGWSAR